MRRLVLGVLSGFVLAALLWTGWWFYLEHRLRAGVEAWAAARRAEGWTVTVRATSLGGWPATARLSLHDVRVRGDGPILPARLDWHAASLDLDLQALSPAVLVLRPRGAQRIAFAGGPPLVARGDVAVQLNVAATAPYALAFTAHDLHVAGANGGPPALISHLSGHALLDSDAGARSDAVNVQFAVGRIDLPRGHAWPLGQVVQSASGDLSITGPVPPAGTPRTRAKAWQQAGGQLRLRQGTLHWGPLEAAGTGDAGLDATLQPSADLVVHATGFAQAMDVLAAHHVLPDHAALAAKAMLSLLATVPPGGGKPTLTVPLSLHDGILAAHGIPLLRAPPLAWPAG